MYKINLRSRDNIQLLWWFLIITGVTIFLKYNYFHEIYRGGISVAIENYLDHDSLLEYIKIIFFMFIQNILEVFILLSLLYITACKYMHINQKLIIIFSMIFIFIAGATNQLSLENVRSFLTFDSLKLSIDWMVNNPDVIKSYITKRNLLAIIFFFILSFLPILLSNSSISKSIVFYYLNRILFTIMTFFVFISFILYFTIPLFFKANTNLKPFHGYWSSLASSFIIGNSENLEKRKILPLKKLKSSYNYLSYPEQHKYNNFITPLKTGKKHIIIVGLETGPQKYYPIINNPKLKNFYKMSQSAIVSNMHFTTAPYTTYAYYSVLTGTYVPPAGTAIVYGKMAFNGIANILPSYGYIPTFIDSYYTDWHEGNKFERIINCYGFKRIFDLNDYNYKDETAKISNEFDKELYAETISFNKIIESIDDAEAKQKKALVFLSTKLGHYEWKTAAGNEHLTNKEKLFEMAKTLDNLFGKLLKSLKERHLTNDVIIVVTGDHGLRYEGEYKSLNETPTNIAIGFNVAFMVYLPNQLKKQIVLKYPTSHIDITPTLLDFIGIDRSSYCFHGDNILNPKLKDRRIFLMNQSLKPESSFYYKGFFYTFNTLSGNTCTSLYKNDSSKDKHINLKMKKTTEKTIHQIKDLFNDTGTYFLHHYNK